MADDDRDELIHIIATVLDKPSLYMGGPSMQSKRRAGEVLDQLEFRGWLVGRDARKA